MNDFIFFSALLWCSAIGLAETIIFIWSVLMCPKHCSVTVFVLPIHSGEINIEYTLRRIHWFLQSGRALCKSRLLIVNYDADDETLAICRAYIKDRTWAELCLPAELEGIVQNSICKTFEGVLY